MRPAGLLLLATIAASLVPGTASAESLDFTGGRYEGAGDDGTKVSFILIIQGDGSSGGTIQDFDLRRPSCRSDACAFLHVGRADVDEGGRADFTGTGSGVPLSRVQLRWVAPDRVTVTWNQLRTVAGTVFEFERDRFSATLQGGAIEGAAGAASHPGPADGAASLAAASPLASTAASRTEYAAQLDPICQGYERPASKLFDGFLRRTDGVLEDQATGDAADTEGRLLGPLGRLIKGGSKLLGRMTARISAVPPPPGDEATVAAWLQSRRTYKRLALRAARAADDRNTKRVLTLLGRASEVVTEGDLLVAGFGFQQCVLTGP